MPSVDAARRRVYQSAGTGMEDDSSYADRRCCLLDYQARAGVENGMCGDIRSSMELYARDRREHYRDGLGAAEAEVLHADGIWQVTHREQTGQIGGGSAIEVDITVFMDLL